MASYKSLTIFGNTERIKLLVEFRGLVVGYLNDTKTERYTLNVIEGDRARENRTEINLLLRVAMEAIMQAGVSLLYTQRASPAMGGHASVFNLFENIFQLVRSDVPNELVIDCVERAIGVYESDRRAAIRRTFNPLFWFHRLLSWIVSLPFRLLGLVGFNEEALEASFLGKLTKLVVYLVTITAGILTISERLGYLPALLNFLEPILP